MQHRPIIIAGGGIGRLATALRAAAMARTGIMRSMSAQNHFEWRERPYGSIALGAEPNA